MKRMKNKKYKYRIDWFDRNEKRESLSSTVIFLRCDIKYLTDRALVGILKSFNKEDDKVFIRNILFQGYRA